MKSFVVKREENGAVDNRKKVKEDPNTQGEYDDNANLNFGVLSPSESCVYGDDVYEV